MATFTNGCSGTTMTELSNYDRIICPAIPKIFSIPFLTQKCWLTPGEAFTNAQSVPKPYQTN